MTTPEQDPFDFKDEFNKIMLLIQAAANMGIQLNEIENTVNKAEALGPFIDPTRYLNGGAENLEQQREVLRIAAPFIRGSQRLLNKYEAMR